MRLKDKIAIVVGAGQTPGETIGNGRATAVLYAREGARVMLVDRDVQSARETEALLREEGGEAFAFEADITRKTDCMAIPRACVERYGRIDILHNNVGIGVDDGNILRLEEDAWDRIHAVNLKGPFMTCKYVLPIMREQRGGVIINISSIASRSAVNLVAYKTSKAALNALTHQLAIDNAEYLIRVNAILPGLMNTPMAIEGQSKKLGLPREEVVKKRDERVPLGHKMGSAWDVAYASLFLASDEAKFITGVLLPVDGGQSCRIG